MKLNRLFVSLSTLCALSLMSPLGASLTTVNPGASGEPNLFDGPSFVMNTLYGSGNWQRIDDSVDQLWTATNGSASVVAKFASNTQTLGYFSGSSSSGTTNGTGFNTLFSVSGNGYSVTGSAGGLTLPSFRWGLETSGVQGTQYFSSLPSDNSLDIAADMDHMVTFLIPATGDYVIAFEDTIQNPSLGFSSDRDFNDAVFQVSGVHLSAPEPATYLILASSLILVAILKRKQQNSSHRAA